MHGGGFSASKGLEGCQGAKVARRVGWYNEIAKKVVKG